MMVAAAARILVSFEAMDPEVSSKTTRLMGDRSVLNDAMSCGTLSSRIVKSALVRPAMGVRAESVTPTSRVIFAGGKAGAGFGSGWTGEASRGAAACGATT